jgi:hypothetical protein
MTSLRRRARLQARDQETTLLLPQVLHRAQGPRCLRLAMTSLPLLGLPRRRDLQLVILLHPPDLPRFLLADPGMTLLLLPDRHPATAPTPAKTSPLPRALLRLTTT